MPALIPTDHYATVTWLGIVATDDRKALLAEPREALELSFEGLAGSVHGGRIRASCSRVTSQHPRGTPIVNERQLSILSVEEMAEIASEMGLDALDPARLGASIVIEGIAESTASLMRTIFGRLSDKVGRRKAFIYLGYGFSAFSKPFLYLAGAWPVVLAVRFADRVGKAARTGQRAAGADRESLTPESLSNDSLRLL